MSDLIRRAVFSNLSSRLTGLIDLWPKRNYRYEELQNEINRAVIASHIQADTISEVSRREALKSVGLVPIQLCVGLDGIINLHKAQADTDTLLKHLAAGITICRYLRRGKDLNFVSDLVSTYISILQPLVYSKSEVHRKAAAGLLAQSLTFKSKLVYILQDDDQAAIAYQEEAIHYAFIAENGTEQVIANREMALYHWWRKKYDLALPYAETAYGLAKNTPRIIRSFTASGLSFCQASCGKTDDAKISLKEAHDFFDPTAPILSIPYGEVILLSSSASVYQHIGNFKEATSLCEKILISDDLSRLGGIYERIKYARIEVSRDDKPRDMAFCITLLTEAITGATELDSKMDIREAHAVYDLLRAAWPREDAIKTLGKDHFGQ